MKAVIITQKLQKATALTMEEIRERKENRKHNCYEKLKTLQGMILKISWWWIRTAFPRPRVSLFLPDFVLDFVYNFLFWFSFSHTWADFYLLNWLEIPIIFIYFLTLIPYYYYYLIWERHSNIKIFIVLLDLTSIAAYSWILLLKACNSC